MNTRTSERGQFLPVFLVVAVIIVIVLIALYLMKKHSGTGVPSTSPVTATIGKPATVKAHVKTKTAAAPAKTESSAKPSADNDAYAIDGPAKSRPLVYKVLPDYPDSAQEQGIQGTVVLGFKIKEDGTVRSNVTLEHSSMSEALDSAAKDSLLQWKFAEGSATDDASNITFKFSLGAPR